MSSREAFVVEAQDGLAISCYRWAPAQPPAAVVLVVHGMGEHALRYEHVAQALTGAGFVVYAHDQRGYGRTLQPGQEPGDIGRRGWTSMVGDIDTVRERAVRDHPDIPVFLVGHSMGSFEVQEYLVDASDVVDAVVLSGTAAADLLFAGVDFDAPLELSAFNAAFEPTRTDADWLSRDEVQVDRYVADPLCGAGLDNEAARAMYDGAVQAAAPSGLSRIRKDLPIYLTVGESDPVNAGMTLVTALVARLQEAGLADVTLRSYPGARHEVFNETNRDEVVADMTAWLRACAAARSTRAGR